VSTHLAAGQYLGAIRGRVEHHGVVVSEIVHETARALPPHSHQAAYFCVLVSGRYAEHIGTRVLEYERFAVTFHPPNFFHRDRIGNLGARFFNVDLGPTWQSSFGDDLTRVPPGLLDSSSSVAAARMHAQHKMGILSREGIDSCVWELVGDAARLAGPREKARTPWMDRCLELLRASIARPITIAEMSAAVDIHPVHLSREFRRQFGRTAGEHLQLLRIKTACGLLGDTALPLADVAAATGFADQSHFTRVFHALIGCTPGRYRALRRSG
jgi:AraC family transcriptional regulator